MANNERYPMCEDQSAQIDYRNENCKFYDGAGKCSNISPAITINPDESYVCWSKELKINNKDKKINGRI